jgi:hypothetical protein
MTSPHPASSSRGRALTVAAAAAAVALAPLVAHCAVRPDGQRGPGIAAAVSPTSAIVPGRCRTRVPLTPSSSTPRPTAPPARHPPPYRPDSRTGRFDAVAMLHWHFDTVSKAGRTRSGTVLTHAQHWRARDGSGRSITSSYPQAGNPGADDIYRPGDVPDADGSLPTDPGLLAARWNNTQPLSSGPQYTLRALADMNLWRSPDRAVRAAAITVLKDTDGINYHGNITDRAERTGIAVSATSDNGGTRDLIILDPHTGELLAYEKAAMRDSGKLGITGPTVLSYRLDLAHTRTAAADPS